MRQAARMGLVVVGMIAGACMASEDARVSGMRDLNRPVRFERRFGSREAWERRAGELRERVLVAAGLWPMPAKTELKPVIHGRIQREGYTVEKVYFESLPGHFVTGNLYRPTGATTGKRPAVLCPHGHWPGGRFQEQEKAEKQVERKAEQWIEGATYPLQARCAMLARMGCVVFLYDLVGYADSQQIGHREGFGDAEAELRLQSFMGLQTWNSIRAMDFLTSLPEVDGGRIGVTGASGGGTQTFILGVVDPRPAVLFPAVMVSEAMQGGCVCENASLLRVGTNNVELAAVAAPRPLGMTGADDWTREIETRGLPQLRHVYGLYGAGERVTAKYFPFDHNYNQVSREMMYGWFNRWLKLGAKEPVKEERFVPVEPKELSVWDERHPRPEGNGAPAVRKWMTGAAERAMAEATKDPEAYRRVVRTALRVMVDDELPGPGEVERTGEDEGYLSRKECGERVPYAIVRPEKGKWNRRVAVWCDARGRTGARESEGVKELVRRGWVVLAFDAFGTGELRAKRDVDPTYAGFTFGYNRSVLAERVHDTLTAIAAGLGAEGASAVDVVGVDKAGVWGLLAAALADEAVGAVAVQTGGFEFEQVKATSDDMMLPGALKYGGVDGLARAGRLERVRVWREGSVQEMVRWVVEAAGVAGE